MKFQSHSDQSDPMRHRSWFCAPSSALVPELELGVGEGWSGAVSSDCTSGFTAAAATCTRPAQGQVSQHPSLAPSPAEDLPRVDGCLEKSPLALGMPRKAACALVDGPVPTCN